MERDYRLYSRVILGFLALGLLSVGGCVGPYMLWGRHPRNPRLSEVRVWTYGPIGRPLTLLVEQPEPELDEVANEAKPMADQ